MIRTYDSGPIAPAGAAASAVGSAKLGPIDGEILGVYISYDAGQAAGTVVALATSKAPVTPVLTAPAGKTSQWFYPRAPLCNESGVALTFDGTHPQTGLIPVGGDYVDVAVSAANPTAPVEVYVVVKTLRPY